MNLYEETKNIMNKYKINANKNLGQNFLIDNKVVIDTVEAACIEKDDAVIEIGPGLGTLTRYLLEKAKKVICIELDNNMINILKDRFIKYDNLEIINKDILKINLIDMINKLKNDEHVKNVKVVANLPYYITTPIVMKLLEEKLDIESITIMVQKEVAERLRAIPGNKNAGAITYSVYYYAKTEKVELVSNEAFIPVPEVESEVIKLIIRKIPPVEVKNEKDFFNLIKISFMQRRKTLINAISNNGIMSKEKIKNILEKLEIDEKIRGENLSIEQFAKISNEM